MIKRILVALSGTPFTPSAITTALELAKAHDAEVTGVTLVDTHRLEDVGPIPLGGATAAHKLTEQRIQITKDRVEEQITAFESACRDAGMIHCIIRETGDAMDQLTELWRYHDLTILGLRGLFEYGVVENPDDRIIKLIAKGVRPILAVAQEHRPVRRVLVAYNGSMESAKAFKRYVQMRLWPIEAIKIACFRFKEDEAESLLGDAAAYCRSHGLTPETESLPGYPEEGLLKHAHHWKADLVVMGATGRSKIAQLILGDTALHAMQCSDIPLFLTR